MSNSHSPTDEPVSLTVPLREVLGVGELSKVVAQVGDRFFAYDPVAKKPAAAHRETYGEALVDGLRWLLKHSDVELLLERGAEIYRLEVWRCC